MRGLEAEAHGPKASDINHEASDIKFRWLISQGAEPNLSLTPYLFYQRSGNSSAMIPDNIKLGEAKIICHLYDTASKRAVAWNEVTVEFTDNPDDEIKGFTPSKSFKPPKGGGSRMGNTLFRMRGQFERLTGYAFEGS